MRQTVAKRLKRDVYGDISPKLRTYTYTEKKMRIEAGPLRQLYQEAKRYHNEFKHD